MPIGPSRRTYAKLWGVDESAIRKAIRAGTVALHPDGSIDVETSDAVWGRRHDAMLAGPEPPDPAWLAKIDAQLAEIQASLADYPRLTDAEMDAMLAELQADLKSF